MFNFRMSFDDFCKNFTHIDLCHLINTSYFSLSKTWHEGEGIGEWKAHRCGGSVGNKDFLLNPQVCIIIQKKILQCFLQSVSKGAWHGAPRFHYECELLDIVLPF